MSPLNLMQTNEQMENNQEGYENMAMRMTQMNLLMKHLMGGGPKL